MVTLVFAAVWLAKKTFNGECGSDIIFRHSTLPDAVMPNLHVKG